MLNSEELASIMNALRAGQLHVDAKHVPGLELVRAEILSTYRKYGDLKNNVVLTSVVNHVYLRCHRVFIKFT